MKLALACAFAFACLLIAGRADATHFRYGNITYTRPDPVNAPRTVRFEVVTAWRSTFIDSTTLYFGDGTNNGSVKGVDIGGGFDAAGLEYRFTKYVATKTYAPGANQFTAYFSSCCRISNLINGPDDSFRVEAKVDLSSTSDKGNPVSLVPAINQLQTGGIRTQYIPAIDPDGTAVTCRFATPTEMGDATTVHPPVVPVTLQKPTLATSASPPGCVLTWDTTGAAAGQQYALSIVLESGATQSAVLDYMIEFVSAVPPTCSGSGAHTVQIGQPFSTSTIGTNNAGGANLKMTAIWTTGTISPLPGSTAGSPMTTTLSWTPSAGDEGSYIATIIYADQLNNSGYCSLSLTVPPCPGYGTACSAGVGVCQSAGIVDCSTGSPACNAVAGDPSAEVCDGLDNDCNGQPDDGDPQGGQACSTGLPGVCVDGLTDCTGGQLLCVPSVFPGTLAETCNAVDDDCDALIDDGFGVGASCSVGVGACASAGVAVCDGMGGTTCNATAVTPSVETCNGVDDNCDGSTDEGFALGEACTAGVGACAASGVTACDMNGATICGAVTGQPTPEQCGNGIDEDCDGTADDDCDDGDADGLGDTEEEALGTDPDDADTDDDGVLDGSEPAAAEDVDGDGLVGALDPDSDDDALFDGTELGLACDDPDTDPAAKRCIADADAGATKTDPLEADSDFGGSTDGSEDADLDGSISAGEADPNSDGDDAAIADSDVDGLSDALEATLASEASDADTDDDGLLDGDEPNPSDDGDRDGLTTLHDVDSDDDALFDGTEFGRGCSIPATDDAAGHCIADGDKGATYTSPVMADTDGGNVIDGSEDSNRDGVVDAGETDPQGDDDDDEVTDADGDGLGAGVETELGSSDDDRDSDDDGLLDGDEPNPGDDRDGDGAIDLLDTDGDGDGLFDGTEAGRGCDDADTAAAASACIADADAGATTTWVLIADTDGGGALDGDEDTNKNGAVDADERDPNDPSDDTVAPGACTVDADCGGETSGQVCDATTSTCIAGCRGEGGNGCPEDRVCSSTDETIGTCDDDAAAGAGGTGGGASTPPEDDGCGCRVVGSPGDNHAALAAALGLLAGAFVRRRRQRAAAR